MGSGGRLALREDTIRRVEHAASRLATQSVARMDSQLPWFRDLPADQRSWVSLVAQAGLQSFVDWLRAPEDVERLAGEVFAAAPPAMARSVSLQQTVELVRLTMAVAEANLPALAEGAEADGIREQLLRFSREIAFAAARVYASAAESRGSWDDRLEALVIDGLVRGSEIGDPLPSQVAALGWHARGSVGALAGTAPDEDHRTVLAAVRRLARGLRLDAMAGVHGRRLVIVFGGADDAEAAARALLPAFGDGPVVLGPQASGIDDAGSATRAALSGLHAAAGWPGAPRPVRAGDLLPERTLDGDADARAELIDAVYRPLAEAGPVLLDTVTTFLDSGGVLEATARTLFVHVNTVRYRLRRVAELCGETATDPRGAFTLRLALTFGRLEASGAVNGG